MEALIAWSKEWGSALVFGVAVFVGTVVGAYGPMWAAVSEDQDVALTEVVVSLQAERDASLISRDFRSLDALTVPGSPARRADRQLAQSIVEQDIDTSDLRTAIESIKFRERIGDVAQVEVRTVQHGIGDSIRSCAVWTITDTRQLSDAFPCE